MHGWMDEWKKAQLGDLFQISFMGIIHKLPHILRGRGGIVFIQQKCISKGGSISSIPICGSNPTQGKLVGTNFLKDRRYCLLLLTSMVHGLWYPHCHCVLIHNLAGMNP